MVERVEELGGHADEQHHLGIVFREQGGEGHSQAVQRRCRRSQAEENQRPPGRLPDAPAGGSCQQRQFQPQEGPQGQQPGSPCIRTAGGGQRGRQPMAQVVDEVAPVCHDDGPGACRELFVNGVADRKVRVLLAVAREAAQQHQQQAEAGQKAQHGQSAGFQRKPLFRKIPGAGVKSIRQCGAKRNGEGGMQPSPQEEAQRKRQVRQCRAQQGACGQGKAGRHGAERRWGFLAMRNPKAQHCIFCPKEKDAITPENEKSPRRLTTTGDLGCFIPVPAKGVRTGRIRCRSGQIPPVPPQSGEGGCIWPCGRNGSGSRS